MMAPRSARRVVPAEEDCRTPPAGPAGAETANADRCQEQLLERRLPPQADADRDGEGDAGDEEDLVRQRVELAGQRISSCVTWSIPADVLTSVDMPVFVTRIVPASPLACS